MTLMDMWVGIGYYIHNVAFKCNMWYSHGISKLLKCLSRAGCFVLQLDILKV